ncbi:hypothetical protein XENOCAPTIV_029310 [Xenoophorus captivus]|uniref:Uncharacterized protein n=1 Tax=Xenoophorus captivus TaxID=1517983 RepID=A0ABV0Q6Q5_9TELE
MCCRVMSQDCLPADTLFTSRLHSEMTQNSFSQINPAALQKIQEKCDKWYLWLFFSSRINIITFTNLLELVLVGYSKYFKVPTLMLTDSFIRFQLFNFAGWSFVTRWHHEFFLGLRSRLS